MLRVGLTGNAAAGKSTVGRWFAAWGCTLIDADQLVRETQRPGSEIIRTIAEAFGPEFVDAGGALRRGALRDTVMQDARARAKLDAIVHPAVQNLRAMREEEAGARGDCVVVHDIPLLFEVLDPSDFDVVVLVDAPEELRLRRLQLDRGLTSDAARHLVDAQQPSAEKRERADIVLDNAGTLDQLQAAARQAWNELRRRAASHAAGAEPPTLVIATTRTDGVTAALAARTEAAGGRVVLASSTDDTLLSHPTPEGMDTLSEQDRRVIVLCDGPRELPAAAVTRLANGSQPVAAWRVPLDDPTCSVSIDIRPWHDRQRDVDGGDHAIIERVNLATEPPVERRVFDLADVFVDAG